jgi:hypothetical protein
VKVTAGEAAALGVVIDAPLRQSAHRLAGNRSYKRQHLNTPALGCSISIGPLSGEHASP